MSDYHYSFYVHRESAYLEMAVDYTIDGYSDPETGEYFGDTSWTYTIGGFGSSGYSSESGGAFLTIGLGSGEEVEDHQFDFSAQNTFSAESISFRLDLLLAGAATVDLVIAGGGDGDLVVSGSGADSLSGGGGDDHIDAGEGDDAIEGGEGDDVINGGEGVDVMSGGAGHDTYHVAGPGDTVVELAGGGGDLVFALVPYTLPDHVEGLILAGADVRRGTGNGDSNFIQGNDTANLLVGLGGDDMLTGHGGRDRLQGADGADSLTGGLGIDRLEGGAGDDNYYVDDRLDAVVEAGNEGSDTVFVFFSIPKYALRANVENLTYTGNAVPFHGVGNMLDNVITGARGGDRLVGLAGEDRLIGGEGRDLLFGGAGADWLEGGLGIDAASYARSNHAVRIDLAAGLGKRGDAQGDLLTGIENVVGSDRPDVLLGDSLGNRLSGGDGSDLINGRGGDDILTGGEGLDRFGYALQGRDRINDFDALGWEVVAISGGAAFDTFEEIMAAAISVGPEGQSTLLRFGAGVTLLLANVAIEDLTAANFGY